MQALITGVGSIVHQLLALDCIPRVKVGQPMQQCLTYLLVLVLLHMSRL